MADWFDNWQKEVDATDPITIMTWRIDAPLTFRKIPLASEWEAMNATSHRIRELIGWHTIGTVFLLDFAEDQSSFSISADQTEYDWPCNWAIIANNQEHALRRFAGLAELINGVSLIDNWIPRIDVSNVPNEKNIEPNVQTLSPMSLATNYPNHRKWSDERIDTIQYDDAISEISKIMASRNLELGTTTVLEATRSLDALVNFLPLVEIDIYNWKWVIIAAHNALQNFMVASLESTYPIRALDMPQSSSSARELEWIIDAKLLKFEQLYDRIKKDKYMMQTICSKKYTHSGSVGNSVKTLNYLRNELTHFTPKLFSLSQHSTLNLPKMLDDIIELIDFLAFESHNVRWHIYPIERLQTREALQQIRALNSTLASRYLQANKSLKLGVNPSQIRLD